MNKLMMVSALSAPLVAGAAGFGGYTLAQNKVESDGYAEVVSVLPVTKNVRVAEPHRECRSVPVTYTTYQRGQTSDTGRNVAVGSVIGGVVGNQVFRGKNQSAATVAGAAIGGYMGYERAKSRNNDVVPVQQTRYEQQCSTTTSYRTEAKADGYDVTYRYNGQFFTTRMETPPPSRFPVAPQPTLTPAAMQKPV